jgi:hypothetical protein
MLIKPAYNGFFFFPSFHPLPSPQSRLASFVIRQKILKQTPLVEQFQKFCPNKKEWKIESGSLLQCDAAVIH